MPRRPPAKPDLGFWLWLIGFLKAISDWLQDVGPDDPGPIEHLPPGHRDAEPAPPRPKPHNRPTPNSTAPGTWNRQEGRWNE